MGILSFVPFMPDLGDFGLTIDNNANIIIGSNLGKVNGIANIVVGDNEVNGIANILIGSGNDVTGNSNIVSGGFGNTVNGNANLLTGAFGNTVDGNANILSGVAGMHFTGNDRAYINEFDDPDFTPFIDVKGATGPSVIIEAPATDDYDGGSIVLGSDIAKNAADGADGADIMVGGDDGNEFSSGDGNDILVGGKGNDILSGGNEDDILVGGEGNDVLTGGDGSDIFGFAPSDGHDQITDFDISEDILDFTSDGQFSNMAGVLANASTAVQAGSTGTLIDMPGSGTLFLEDVTLAELATAEIHFG